MLSRIMKLVMVLCAAAFFSAAMAQAEPTLNQVYEAARTGHVDKAQDMMKGVLRAHPKSGKAHYVQAELYARQKQLTLARDELATAESLSPGLSFAKPEAVRALRSELALPSAMSGMTDFKGTSRAAPQETAPARVAPAAPAPVASSSFPWGMLLLGGVFVVLVVAFMRRNKPPVPAPYGAPAYAQPGGGMQPGPYGAGAAPSPYGPGPAPYGAPPASGMGGNIMGGLATGLAVGAGVVAAESLGRRFFGNDHAQGNPVSSSGGSQGALDQSQNPDMGGNDFGIRDADAGSWDDGGSSMADSGDGGGGWDS